MKTTVVIAEKPSVMHRIAYSIAPSDVKPKRLRLGKASYYELKLDDRLIYVCSCAGHLFESDFKPELRRDWKYPVIADLSEIMYEPRPGVRDFIELVRKLTKDADEIVIATDYDREGSYIGLECLENICNLEPTDRRIKRMLFNALTPKELRKSFENLQPFDVDRAVAGKLRAYLDLLWGANVTRALTLATRKFKPVRLLSAGRVQTPTLKLILDRHIERESFKPRDFWEVHATFATPTGQTLEAVYIDPRPEDGKYPTRIFSETQARSVVEACLKASLIQAEVSVKRIEEKPPIPFSITVLQREAQRLFGFSPSYTKKLAQRLYESGLCSYPRSGSTKFDMRPGKHDRRYFRALLRKLRAYAEEAVAEVIEKTSFVPRQGAVFDMAHPPIHAVDVPNKRKLSSDEQKLYELVFWRTIALFAPNASLEESEIVVRVDGMRFEAKGLRLLDPGWRKYYPFARKLDERLLPPVRSGETLSLKKAFLRKGQTKPPRPYTPADIIRLMEKVGIGTPATRDDELDKLYQRGYILGRKVVRPTPLGSAVVEVLEDLVEELTSPGMTARMEGDLTKVEFGQLSPEEFAQELKEALVQVLTKFKSSEAEIGKRLAQEIPIWRAPRTRSSR